MDLHLPPHFSFAQFKRVAPVDPDTLWELVYARNAHDIKVKRASAAVANLQKIIEATFRLANQMGFSAMSLRDLTQATGLSMGGLYGYLQTKDDLAAMIEDVIRHFAGEIPTWFASGPTPADRVDGCLRAHVFLSELLQPWFYFVFMESRVLQAAQRQVAKAAELDFQAALAGQIEQMGNLDRKEAFLLSAHMLTLAQDWYVKRWKFRAEKIGVDAFADSLSALLAARLGR